MNYGSEKIVVIGGSAAEPKAAAKARRLDQKAEITLIQREPDLSMASCGYPYYVGGFFNDRNMLLATPTGVVRDPGFFLKTKNIKALTETEAVAIDRVKKTVTCTDQKSGTQNEVAYDKLILCTGAGAALPPVPGIELQGVTTLLSMAIQGEMILDRLVCADLPYAPPFSLAIDHFIASAHIVENKLKGRLKTISAEEVQEKIKRGEKPFLLDGRGPDEYEVLRLGLGEKYIPVGALRARLDELPADKNAEMICFCKVSLRGYETALILEEHGWINVKVMEGGIVAWPYGREK